MRIDRLDLLAYGRFTRQRLELGEGLHLLYGPNEAGKSTTLNAVRHLLFGFEHTITHAFLHPAESLRLGGVLAGRAGRIEFIRRRGRTKTLRAPDDVTPLDDAALRQYLPCEDASQFEAAFGLTHQRLVEGGEAMLKSNGEYGQQLFAASRGILGLRAVQQELEERAQALFVPRGSSRRINAAVAQWEKAIKRKSSSATTAAEYRRIRDALEGSEHAAREVQQQQREGQAFLQRLQRLQGAIPLLHQRRAALATHAPLQGARLLPENFAMRYQQALAREGKAQALVSSLREGLARITQQRATLTVPEALLTHQARIDHLYRELGTRQKAESDRSRRAAELQALEQELRGLRRELGLEESVPLPSLTAEERTRIHALADRRQAIMHEEQEAQRNLEKSRAGLLDTERDLRTLPAPPAVDDLRRTVQRVERDGVLEETLRKSEQARCELQGQLDRDLVSLSPWAGTLKNLEGTPVPSVETVKRCEEELRAWEVEDQRVRERRREEAARVQRTDARLRALERTGVVPTEAELAAARAHRQGVWQQVRATWESGDRTLEPLASQFERAADIADGTSDHMRRDAQRVAEKAALQDESREGQTRLTALEAEQLLLQGQKLDWQQRWENLWQGCGFVPLPPMDMAGWLQRRERLLERAQRMREVAHQYQEHLARRAVHRADLGRELERAGRPGAAPDESLTALLDRAALVFQQASVLAEKRAKLTDALAFFESGVPSNEKSLAGARHARNAWQEAWIAAVRMLPVSPQASPDEVRLVLDLTERAQQKHREAEGLRARVAAILCDASHFGQAIADIVRLTVPDLAGQSPEAAAAELWQRLVQAISARDQRARLDTEGKATRIRLDTAELELRESQQALESLCREAGGVAVNELFACIGQSEQRRAAEQRLREVDQQLAVCASTLTLDQLAIEAEGVIADDLPARVAEVRQEGDRLADREAELHRQCGERQAELDRLQGDSETTQAAEEAESWRARIEADVEEFVRVRLAAAVLKGAMERYGKANQGPLLERSSELFRLLTCGSFAGLRLEWEEHGRATLVGVRPNGSLVDALGMSEGIRDQLYLALRLASLERHCAEHDPVPFIVDDILVNLDDLRSVAALRALEQLAKRTQVLLFTHHQHLVGLAQKSLPTIRLTVHQLHESAAVGAGD